MDAVLARLNAAGIRIISASGVPETAGGSRWLMVQGPDNVFLQLFEPGSGQQTDPEKKRKSALNSAARPVRSHPP